MCTATWLQRDGSFRVYFNRDELRTRGAALPPRIVRREGVRIAAPLDGDAGGSWIGANEAGLVAFLLNGYVEEAATGPAPSPPPGGWQTRGELLFGPLAVRDLEDATARLEAIDASRYRTFVLGVLGPEGVGSLARWLDGELRVAPLLPAGMPLSSSSFDTLGVISRRRDRWERERPSSGAGLADAHATHLAYHASREPDSGAHSVCMSRPDAATRSFTWVDVGPERVALHYLDHPPCEAGTTTTIELERS